MVDCNQFVINCNECNEIVSGERTIGIKNREDVKESGESTMIRKMKKFLSLLAALAVTVTAAFSAPTQAQAASGATGVGLAEHCMTAYYERWSYVYGGTSYGAVDCSGLIVTYKGVGGCRTDLLGASSESGLVRNGVPRIHGLGLKQPGHVGVYVGNGMFVDARSESQGICYQSMSRKNWVYWFKVAGVTYPTTG